MKDVGKLVDRIVAWIREKIEEAGVKGGVVGISGGVDSAVVVVLLKRAVGDRMLGILMPCHSDPSDTEDALMLVRSFDIPYRLVDLSPVYDAFLQVLGERDRKRDLSLANIKPRLRMITLYHFANKLNYLVVGTSNKSELEVGYFTKYGDGGVDILPIGGLLKTQVWEVARFLGIPDKIINKPPSAGFWEGQTDEEEMGVTYKALDAYLLEGKGDPDVIKKIEEMRRRSEHKRRLPQVFLPEK